MPREDCCPSLFTLPVVPLLEHGDAGREFIFGSRRCTPRVPAAHDSLPVSPFSTAVPIWQNGLEGCRAIDMTTKNVNLVSPPLVQHKLSLMRERDRSIKSFRELLNEIGMLLCYEVTRDLPLELVDIETPLQPMKAPMIAGKKLTLAPILRAGVGFLDGMLAMVPSARVAHIGLYRDPKTLQAVEYYFKAPQDLSDRVAILMDPMLATGNSACAAATLLKSRGARDIRFVCLLAAPEGIARFQRVCPAVPIWTAAIDERLNDHGYIVPGLGDAGDGMFGTK